MPPCLYGKPRIRERWFTEEDEEHELVRVKFKKYKQEKEAQRHAKQPEQWCQQQLDQQVRDKQQEQQNHSKLGPDDN